MTLRVNVERGTAAGRRPPYSSGHAPTCQCSRCETRRRFIAEHDAAYERAVLYGRGRKA